MATQIQFNINYNVKVKLTPEGEAELKRQHIELAKHYPQVNPYKLKPEDDKGYVTFQLHILMNTFGHMLILGQPTPFETTIILIPEGA